MMKSIIKRRSIIPLPVDLIQDTRAEISSPCESLPAHFLSLDQVRETIRTKNRMYAERTETLFKRMHTVNTVKDTTS